MGSDMPYFEKITESTGANFYTSRHELMKDLHLHFDKPKAIINELKYQILNHFMNCSVNFEHPKWHVL